MTRDKRSVDHLPQYFDAARIKEYLDRIEQFHSDGEYRWEVGFVDQLLWAACCDAKTTDQLRSRRRAALAKLSPLAGSCVTGAERVMDLLSVTITGKAIASLKEYLVALDRPYRAECELLLERRVLDLQIDHDVPAPENKVFELTEFVMPALSRFVASVSHAEQEAIFAASIEPYIKKTLARIEIEKPPCWANICIVAPILRRIRILAVECLEACDSPLSFKCDVDGEWWKSEADGYEHGIIFEIEKNQPEMTDIRLVLDGRERTWSKELGNYDLFLFKDAALSQYFACEVFPTDEELQAGKGVLHFRLTYHLKNCRTRNDFREIRFDREFMLAGRAECGTDGTHVEPEELSVGAWLRSREKAETIVSSLQESEVIGEYVVRGMIGRGGSGEVYCVQHRALGTRAAIKLLFKDNKDTRARFDNEAKILATERHVGFPAFFAYGEMGGRPYLVEELLSPGDFPDNDEGVANFLMKFCPAVDYLHKQGYVHRDIKPGNILFRGDQPVLVDFGLVKKVQRQSYVTGPRLSMVDGRVVGVGTPGFAAPEQILGEDLDITADIHSIGMLIAEFFGNKLPPQWETIVNTATNSRRQARYQSIDELMMAVRNRQYCA